MPIRAACFDLGGVMVRISYRWGEMLGRCGFAVPEWIQPEDDLHSMPTFDDYQAGQLTDVDYFRDLAAYLQISVTEAERVHCSMLIEPFTRLDGIVAVLKLEGVVTGCLSNTNAPHWQELTASGRFPAIESLDVKLASFEIGASKPDARAFEAFEHAIQTEAGEIVLFDDSHINCEAAVERGWQALHIDPGADPARQMRDWLSGR